MNQVRQVGRQWWEAYRKFYIDIYIPVAILAQDLQGPRPDRPMMLRPWDAVTSEHEHESYLLENKSHAQRAWPLVQRFLDECREAVIKQATGHIEKCLEAHMMAKWARGAEVKPPPLVSSSSSSEAPSYHPSSDDESRSKNYAASKYICTG